MVVASFSDTFNMLTTTVLEDPFTLILENFTEATAFVSADATVLLLSLICSYCAAADDTGSFEVIVNME